MINIFAPKGNTLRDFCYINLFVYSGLTKLLSGTFREKIQYAALKNKLRLKINRINKAVYYKNCFKIDELKLLISKQDDNDWDKLLNNVVLQVIIKHSMEEFDKSTNAIFNEIIYIYTLEVQNRHAESQQKLDLKNEKMEIETSMDLMVAEVCYKNNKGQFSRIR